MGPSEMVPFDRQRIARGTLLSLACKGESNIEIRFGEIDVIIRTRLIVHTP